MFKLLLFLKRKEGMSFEAFVDYYKTRHARVGERALHAADRYFRRFIKPMPDPVTGEIGESEYDVVTEVWFKDRAAFDTAMAEMSAEQAAELVQDEDQLFDRARIRMVHVVDEDESTLG